MVQCYDQLLTTLQDTHKAHHKAGIMEIIKAMALVHAIHTQIATVFHFRAKGYLLTLFSCFELSSCGTKESMEVRKGSGHMRVM